METDITVQRGFYALTGLANQRFVFGIDTWCIYCQNRCTGRRIGRVVELPVF